MPSDPKEQDWSMTETQAKSGAAGASTDASDTAARGETPAEGDNPRDADRGISRSGQGREGRPDR